MRNAGMTVPGPKIVFKSVVEQPMNGMVESVVDRGSMEELEKNGAGDDHRDDRLGGAWRV